MKVRGTPQHIAEKYVQLARDAHSSGDTVMAESYLQHAEHYYRIIAAAQNAQNAAYNQANGLPSTAPDDAMDDEDEFEVAGADRFTFRTPQSFQQNAQGGGYSQGGYGQQGFQGGQGQSFGDVPGVGDQPSIGADGQPVEGGQQGGFQPRPRGARGPSTIAGRSSRETGRVATGRRGTATVRAAASAATARSVIGPSATVPTVKVVPPRPALPTSVLPRASRPSRSRPACRPSSRPPFAAAWRMRLAAKARAGVCAAAVVVRAPRARRSPLAATSSPEGAALRPIRRCGRACAARRPSRRRSPLRAVRRHPSA